LAVAYGVVAVSAVAGFAADATGHPDWSAGFTVGAAAVNLFLTLLLVPRFGAIGAAYALLVTGALLLVSINYAVQRWLVHLPVVTVVKEVLLRPLIAGASITVYGAFAAPRVRGLGEVAGALILGGILYLALTVVLGVWNEQELKVARSMTQAAVTRVKRAF
jgi:O-antigen/teichoic acid export membrane protein